MSAKPPEGLTSERRGALLLFLHPDLATLRAFPLPLLVIDMPLELFHRDSALSTRHAYTSIAPKPIRRRDGGLQGFGSFVLLHLGVFARRDEFLQPAYCGNCGITEPACLRARLCRCTQLLQSRDRKEAGSVHRFA